MLDRSIPVAVLIKKIMETKTILKVIIGIQVLALVCAAIVFVAQF